MAISKRSEEDEVNGFIRPPTSNVFMLWTASLFFDGCVFAGHLGVAVPLMTCTIAFDCVETSGEQAVPSGTSLWKLVVV